MPPHVRDWVERELGAPVVEVKPRTGGMSPAVAASLVAANGQRCFLKAVSPGINPDTPGHFRHEITVLAQLPPAPYRAGLQATYDDGDWVGILLDDVDGHHPDWDNAAEVEAVLEVVQRQAKELTPCPPGIDLPPVSAAMNRHLETMLSPTEEQLGALPDWARQRFDELKTLIIHGRDTIDGDTLCHWDVRHDNVLIRTSDGQPVLVDWGMCRRGPWWGDAMVFALEWAELPFFDSVLRRTGLSADEEATATGFLAALGCYLTMASTFEAPPGLPQLPAFRLELGLRCLTGVRRRLAG